MSLLIFLSIPAIAGIIFMAVAISNLVLYPRLKGRECRVIQFPVRGFPVRGADRPDRRKAA